MTLLLAFLLMLLIVAGMSVGVMFGRKPLAGSCGGMKALGLDTQCEICGGDTEVCARNDKAPRSRAHADAAALGSDAMPQNRPGHTRAL